MEYRQELVASFPKCRRFSPWPRCIPRAACAPSAARKMRGTPRQSLGRNARDRRLFCSVLQKCTGRTYLHFLLTPQEVRATGKTRNRFITRLYRTKYYIFISFKINSTSNQPTRVYLSTRWSIESIV